MNNSILIAVAIIATAVIVKLPPIGPQTGRYQVDSSSMILIDTTTGARWAWMGANGWRQWSTGVTP